MNAKEILTAHLQSVGADGFMSDDHYRCRCDVDELLGCFSALKDLCKPAKKTKCPHCKEELWYHVENAELVVCPHCEETIELKRKD